MFIVLSRNKNFMVWGSSEPPRRSPTSRPGQSAPGFDSRRGQKNSALHCLSHMPKRESKKHTHHWHMQKGRQHQRNGIGHVKKKSARNHGIYLSSKCVVYWPWKTIILLHDSKSQSCTESKLSSVQLLCTFTGNVLLWNIYSFTIQSSKLYSLLLCVMLLLYNLLSYYSLFLCVMLLLYNLLSLSQILITIFSVKWRFA